MRNIALMTFFTVSVAAAKKPAAPVTVSSPPVAQAQASAEPQELKVGVKGMVCAFCAQGIEKKFKSQPEVSNVNVNLENKLVTLKFKEGKTLPKSTIIEILKDAGYEATFGE